jgi:hypothetical protein
MSSSYGTPLSELLAPLSAAERDGVENFFMDCVSGEELCVEISKELVAKLRRYHHLSDGAVHFCSILEGILASAPAGRCGPMIDLGRDENFGDDF